MFVALLNFKGDTIDKISNLTEEIGINNDKDKFHTLQMLFGKGKNKLESFKSSDLFEFTIYQMFFLKYIAIHFKKLFEELFKPEEMFLSYFKFKNMYIVEMTKNRVILDWLRIKKNKKNIKYYNNDKLWFELIHHSKSLMDSYKNEHRLFFSNSNSSYRFVKFECTSTFPRITFIIKFIPILKGLSFIHIYSQKKLSRISENQEQTIIKGYKEIDLLYGAETKTNANIEFRYTEPKVLKKIEKFLIEFLISIRKSDVFRDPNLNRELKYFNYTIISKINSIPSNQDHATIDELIEKINIKLKEMHDNLLNDPDKYKDFKRTISMNSRLITEQECFDNYLKLKNEDVLNDIFKTPSKNDIKNAEMPKKRESINLIELASENSSGKSLSLSKIEVPFKNNVTINQSRDVSEIHFNNQNKSIKKEVTQMQFEKLLEMTSNTVNFALFKKDNKKDESITQSGNIKNNGNKLNIDLHSPNMKENKEQVLKKNQKLIILEAENNKME